MLRVLMLKACHTGENCFVGMSLHTSSLPMLFTLQVWYSMCVCQDHTNHHEGHSLQGPSQIP